MKTILIFTDLSKNGNHAAKVAAVLCPQLQADILLYHNYYDPYSIPAYAKGPWVVEDLFLRKEECTKKLNQLAIELRHIIAATPEDKYHPIIEYECGQGQFAAGVSAILRQKDVTLIVIGTSSGSTIHHAFYGSDSMAIINSSVVPVLVIAPGAETIKLKKITLASAFETADIVAIHYLAELSKTLGFLLEIVHIKLPGEPGDNSKKQSIYDYLAALKQENLSWHEIRGKNLIKRLNKLCRENDSDILAVVHYEHGFLSKIFNKCTTEEVITNQHIPLMIIPSKLKTGETPFRVSAQSL
ncbi:MAG: universal stress protein [Mucilaginibacter sp.]